MHYNGSIYGRTTIKKKEEKVVTIMPLWKKALLKLDVPVYIAAGIWVMYLYYP